jgi:hypothetical protein
MSEPYRSAGGLTCPRCNTSLVEDNDALICSLGCGTWLPRALVDRLVGSRPLVVLCTQSFGAAEEPFEVTHCRVCARRLEALYPSVNDHKSLAIGVCRDDGVWLQRASRSDFLDAFAAAAKRERNIVEIMAALRTADDASLRVVAMRIVAVEEKLAELEKKSRR